MRDKDTTGPTVGARFGDARLPTRFWSKVSQLRSGCWSWSAGRDRDGYGRFAIKSYPHAAHRVAFSGLVRQLADDEIVHHTCREKSCVNPAHMVAMGKAEHDALHCVEVHAVGVERTHCVNGHQITLENTQWNKGTGVRLCRACRIEQRRASYHRVVARKAAEAQP